MKGTIEDYLMKGAIAGLVAGMILSPYVEPYLSSGSFEEANKQVVRELKSWPRLYQQIQKNQIPSIDLNDLKFWQ